MVCRLYIIKAVFFFFKKAGDTCPPKLIGKLGIKQNGPVKHFKGMLVISCKWLLPILVTSQFPSHLLTPYYGPGPEVAREESGERE